MFNMGLTLRYNAIAIPALMGKDPINNPDEYLRITEDQVSWLGKHSRFRTKSFITSFSYISEFRPGSTVLIIQAVGSLFSGLLSSWLGRKRAMCIVNVPHIIGWALIYSAGSLREIFIGNILLGLGNGLMEAPALLFVGEIA